MLIDLDAAFAASCSRRCGTAGLSHARASVAPPASGFSSVQVA